MPPHERKKCGAAGAANFNDVCAAGAAPYPYMIVHGVGMGRKDMGGEGAEEKTANASLKFTTSYFWKRRESIAKTLINLKNTN